MPKYITFCAYSCGSWARMMRRHDDRATMARILTESLGGSLECIYWEVSTGTSFAIVNLPDSACASAAAAVLTQTGAFKNVEVHEVLTQDQLSDALALAGEVSKIYQAPGQRQPVDAAF